MRLLETIPFMRISDTFYPANGLACPLALLGAEIKTPPRLSRGGRVLAPSRVDDAWSMAAFGGLCSLMGQGTTAR